MVNKIKMIAACGVMGLSVASFSAAVTAYDGTNCDAPGDCWQPKPGFPEKIEGTKYDPKHSKEEVGKQQKAIKAMERRNAKRAEHFKETGDWIFDVSKIE